MLDKLVTEGGDPPRSSRPRAWRRSAAATSSAPIVDAALDANADVAEKLRGGDMKPIGVIIGHVMRETRGRADGGEVTRMVREKLSL